MLQETLIKATRAGAAVLEKFFNAKDLHITNKEGINNLVTEADHAAEKAIIETIRAAFPDHYLLTEESGELPTSSNYKWIIDPIDGTVNFANGIPICCVSIGVEKDGQMIHGAVYNPIFNEFYLAEKGKGATLNGQPIQVSEKAEISSSCLVTGFPYTYLDMPNGPLQCFERFIRKGIPVRRLGSAAPREMGTPAAVAVPTSGVPRHVGDGIQVGAVFRDEAGIATAPAIRASSWCSPRC